MILIDIIVTSVLVIAAATAFGWIGWKLAVRSKSIRTAAIGAWLVLGSVFQPQSSTSYEQLDRSKKKRSNDEDNRNVGPMNS